MNIGHRQIFNSWYLLCHLLSWSVAEVFGCCTAVLGHTAAGGSSVAQQVGVNGVCQLVIGCCQLSSAEWLCTRVVRLLSAPLQRHQELLQRSSYRGANGISTVPVIKMILKDCQCLVST